MIKLDRHEFYKTYQKTLHSLIMKIISVSFNYHLCMMRMQHLRPANIR